MPSFREIQAEITKGWRLAAVEQERASRAAALAARREEQAGIGSASLRPFHTRMAALHRTMATRHRTCARMHALHAARLRKWAGGTDHDTLRPVFMAAVAAALGVPSASVTLLGAEHSDAMVAASDETARTAHELEFVLGEGPAGDAVRDGKPVQANGDELTDRWPQYGPALAEVGVRSVVATPLRLPTVCLGALCVFDRQPVPTETARLASGPFADALTQLVLDDDGGDGVPGLSLFHDADFQAVVHQAAGMVSVLSGCTIDDALALLRARAFTDGRPVEDVATDVVGRRLTLG